MILDSSDRGKLFGMSLIIIDATTADCSKVALLKTEGRGTDSSWLVSFNYDVSRRFSAVVVVEAAVSINVN